MAEMIEVKNPQKNNYKVLIGILILISFLFCFAMRGDILNLKKIDVKNIKIKLVTRHINVLWLYIVHFVYFEIELEEDKLIFAVILNNKLYQEIQQNKFFNINFEAKFSNLVEDIVVTKIPASQNVYASVVKWFNHLVYNYN